ncbi:MAG: GMC family oxidoreductase [Acetobacteraceae bacterium]|nr:GMC family oxidoreductase [Acetobacteraceae bacterium]
MSYDAIVVGTGFGASVAVSKLVERGQSVLVLERGTWWTTPERLGKPPAPPPPDLPTWAAATGQPVQYWPRPDHTDGLLDLFASVRWSGNVEGLYVLSQFDECNIVSASGVGGGSLIYSTATMQPDAAVLAQIGLTLTDADYQAALDWTQTNRGLLSKIVTKFPLPDSKQVSDLGNEDYLYLDRSRALRDAAAVVKQRLNLGDGEAEWAPLDLAIHDYRESGPGNQEALRVHTFCERQGRCILGCLPQATQSLDKMLFDRYLADGSSGVTLWPLAEVRTILSAAGGWEVTFRDHRADGQEQTVTAPRVFLGAGTLGTNEILLRSREAGLALSDQIGQGFSNNGNFAGFCVGTAYPVNSTRGPMNTCHVNFQLDGRHLIVEDCAIPAMAAPLAAVALRLLDNPIKRELFKGALRLAWMTKRIPDLGAFLSLIPDTRDPASYRTEAEAVADVFFFNAMGQDEANGRFSLDGDELDLKWDPPLTGQPVFAQIESLLIEISNAMASSDPSSGYVPFPVWRGLGMHKLDVTHPLGGCRIAGDSSSGVVDEYGRVYDGAQPAGSAEVHPGLVLVDASVSPGAVVAHPTLTIMAQALKTMTAAV